MTKPSLLLHQEEVASRLRAGPCGLFLDLDGTLADIVPTPGQATIGEPVRAALAALAARLRVVSIVTGRPVEDARRIIGLDQLTYVGNHGLERLEDGRLSLAPEVRPHREYLHRVFLEVRARCSGTDAVFEEKRASFSIHYRNSADPQATEAAVVEALRVVAGEGVRAHTGKAHVNVLPPVPLNKGTAVASLVRERGLACGLVAGDDVTDIDSLGEARSLAAQSPFSLVAVAVLGEGCPDGLVELADYTLANPAEMERFLVWLAQGKV